jgi:hypothetical protein
MGGDARGATPDAYSENRPKPRVDRRFGRIRCDENVSCGPRQDESKSAAFVFLVKTHTAADLEVRARQDRADACS